jgi:DNA-binding transcriptional LysR family regulator
MGVRLLNRTTRSVAPTSVGNRLYGRIEPMMAELDGAVTEAMAAIGRAAGLLRINTPGLAATKLIAPRLGRFHRAHPDVVLDLTTASATSSPGASTLASASASAWTRT